MKSLVVAPILPSDTGSGLAMRVGMFAEAFHRLGGTHVMVLPVAGSGEAGNTFCRRLGLHATLISITGRADTEFTLVSNVADPEARLEAFRRYGRPTLASHLSVPVLQDVRGFAAGKRFDLVHIARSYLLPVIGAWPRSERPPVWVDLDEDDAATLRRIATVHALRGDAFSARWQQAEATAFDRLIARWLPETDAAFISTDAEAKALGKRHAGPDSVVVRNAVALPPAPAPTPQGLALVFVGGFGYFPNLDAALWLIEAVLPLLLERGGAPASLTLVGRNPPQRLRRLAERPGVRLRDDVEDLAPIYAHAGIALVPLRAGGGSRIKLLEAAAHGVPVVATSIGAEDSGLRDGRDIWIADTPDAIADACLQIMRAPDEARKRADAARAFVERFRSRTATISTLEEQFANRFGVDQAARRGG